jgi:hypothetical protein
MPDSSIAALSRELQALHRLLLRAEAGSLGLSADPYKLMGAAMSDPRLAWLNPLLKLIVAIDEADDAGQLAEPEALAAMRGQIEALLSDPQFGAHDADWRGRLPDVAASHAKVRELLDALPQTRH